MKKCLTTKEFIKKAREIHGDKYDYSKVEYINNRTKVCIICPEHGEFWQVPYSHLNGSGCKFCGNKKISEKSIDTKERFIEKAKNVHGNKYDYSKVEYIDSKTKVCIICPKHGEFWQRPSVHLIGCGCNKCGNEKKASCRLSNTEKFIKKSIELHDNKYDYSKVNYTTASEKVCIICPKHGEFWQTPNNHLRGTGCQKCYDDRRNYSTKYTSNDFIQKAKKIHGDKYDYSKVDYINTNTKICIICPKHGEFWQRPDHHLTSKCGCPKCQTKHLEIEIENMLKENSIKYEVQKTFDWLKLKTNLLLDFYLPDYNIAIECQGRQHFEPVDIFGGKIEFDKQIERDEEKKKLCKENNIDLIYFSNKKLIFEKLFNKKDEVLTYIKEKKENQ